MTYIVTHCQHVQDARPWTDVKSRRSVATLFGAKVEAHAVAQNAMPEPGALVPVRIVLAIEALSVAGGTVELPDGTVIEVERESQRAKAEAAYEAACEWWLKRCGGRGMP